MFKFYAIARLALCVLLTFSATLTASQTEGSSENTLQDWQALSIYAETILDNQSADVKELDHLRSRIVSYRDLASSLQTVGEHRIRTLENRLDALGPPAEENQSEPAAVTELRESLQTQLDDLVAPKILALETIAHANGLIAEIDASIRDLEEATFLSRGPAPINPANWAAAISDVGASFQTVRADFDTGLAGSLEDPVTQTRLPIAAFICLFGLALWWFRYRWSEIVCTPLRTDDPDNQALYDVCYSALSVAFPIVGTFLIAGAFEWSFSLGPLTSALVISLPMWIATLLFSHWLIQSLLAHKMRSNQTSIPTFAQRRLRNSVLVIAASLVASDAGTIFDEFSPVRSSSQLLFQSLSVVTAALALGVLYLTVSRHTSGVGSIHFTNVQKHIVKVIKIVTPVLAIGCPVIALIGYVPVSMSVLFAFVKSLAIISTVFLVHQFVEDISTRFSAAAENSVRGTLLADLIVAGLYLLTLPLLALSWGARPAELQELWERFLQGLTIGETRISPQSILAFLVIFLIGYALVKFVQKVLRDSILPKTGMKIGTQSAVALGFGYVGYFLAFLIALSGAGISLSSLAIVAGALSVGIGFGLQTLVANFVSGIFLLFSRPISKGDWVEIDGKMGHVQEISVRSTTIETFDRTELIVPNQDIISGTVINYTKNSNTGRVIVSVGVAYGSDTKQVEDILLSIAEDHPMVLANPKPMVVLQELDDSAIVFEIRAIVRDINWVLSVKTDLYHAIIKRFEEEQIEIPFNQQVVWLHNSDV